MATRRNRKTRKNYKKSRKNYKRVKRGGLSSNYDEQREAISYNGPMDITKDPEYKRIDRNDRMINFDKNFKKQQQNEISEGINKERLSQLTRLNAFQSLDSEQQKNVATTFMNSDGQKQDEIFKYYKLLTESNKSQDIKELKKKQQFTKLSPEDKTEVVRAYLALPEGEKENFLNFFTGGKTKKRRRNKKTRGGGECRDSVSKATTIDELNRYKGEYCGLAKVVHKKCCEQIEGHLNTLQKSNYIIEKDIQNKNLSEESKDYSFDDYTEFPRRRDE